MTPETGAWKADAEAQKRQIARKRSIKLLDLELRESGRRPLDRRIRMRDGLGGTR